MIPTQVVDDTVDEVLARHWRLGDLTSIHSIQNMNAAERQVLARHELVHPTTQGAHA